MSVDAMRDRRDFLERNQDDLIRRMQQSGIAKPVGVVVDVRDFHGHQFAIAVGLLETDIDALIAKYEGQMIPTVSVIITWEQARKIMPFTSPNATENLNAAWRLCSLTGQALAISIMAKGNTYALVSLPKSEPESPKLSPPTTVDPIVTLGSTELTSEGQNRHGGYRRLGDRRGP
jgi:hypothetical protein